jgi:soluble lytic murein transglycosylase-like protein
VRAIPDREERARAPDDGSAVAARVHAEIAKRMPGQPPSLRARVAQAVLVEARRARLDPLLVVALICVESSFDPEVVSEAGAVGLMQLREPTMRRELERSGLAESDPDDPVTNVRAGVRYLRRLVDAFGVMDVALMAYNAGPNRIRGHLRAGRIPDRFHVYPRKVRTEVERLRQLPRRPAAVVAVEGRGGGAAG